MSDLDQFRHCDARQLLELIGARNMVTISGGRVHVRPTGIHLPVMGVVLFGPGGPYVAERGYFVTADLASDGTYVVRRIFQRGPTVWIKGEQRGVQPDELGGAVYRASCYRSGFGDSSGIECPDCAGSGEHATSSRHPNDPGVTTQPCVICQADGSVDSSTPLPLESVWASVPGSDSGWAWVSPSGGAVA